MPFKERANIISTGVNGIHDEGDSSTMIRCNINAQNQQLSDNVGGCMLDILKTDMKAVITGNTIGTEIDGDITLMVLKAILTNILSSSLWESYCLPIYISFRRRHVAS